MVHLYIFAVVVVVLYLHGAR